MKAASARSVPIDAARMEDGRANIRVMGTRVLAFWRNYRAGLLLWVVFVLYLALVQFSTPDLPDNDGFYHIKLAYLMRTEGLKPDFVWLPLSILNRREFYDHHFGFHVALIPFTFGDLRLGAKWAAVFFASLAFMSVWNLLKNQRIRPAGLWAFGLLAISDAFIYRMSIPRAQSLSLAVLIVAVDWLLRRKFARLILLAALYVWLYDAFPLLLLTAGIYVLATGLIERRLDPRPVLFVGVGTAAGLFVNPYFPHDVVFAVLHILPKLVATTAASVGNEWYPYETAQLLKNSFLALAAFVSGALALGLSARRMQLRTAFSFLLACLFGLMLFQARRFIEYFPPFALIFAIFAWTPVIALPSAKPVDRDFKTARKGTASGIAARVPPALGIAIRRWFPAAALIAVLLPGIVSTFNQARASMQTSKSYETYAAASAWLVRSTPPGSRVFQTDWDDFPRLFYYNTHNTYLVGLDPTYMQTYDAGLYDLWVDITREGSSSHPE